MYFDLTKGEKKSARFIMDKGLENEYKEGLELALDIVEKWKDSHKKPRAAYMELIKGLDRIDKNISRRHDGKGGSRYVEIIASQLADNYISIKDLEPFHDKTKNLILLLAGKISIDD
jgi:hypothetical protein